MSNIKELIRAEIRKWRSIVEERCPESTRSRDYTKEEWNAIYEYNAYTRILSFLDTLPDEPEQPTKGYDEAYLNEKIAKASKSWEGVDVDKFMDEVRGRELVTDCNDWRERKTFDDYLKASPSERRKMNMAEILGEEREMKIWHEIAKEYPPIGETVCILWNDGIITTDVWDEEDSISPWMKYWCLSSDICLPKE